MFWYYWHPLVRIILKFVELAFVLATVGVPATCQSLPLSPPKQWVVKSEVGFQALKPATSEKDKDTSNNSTVIAKQVNSPESRCEENKSAANENVKTQHYLVVFTGLLVVVGFLQFAALIGQITIYYRQAKIMEKQHITMGGQLATMDSQLLQMKSAGEQTDKIIEHAAKQVSAAEGQVRLMETSGSHTEGLARQAVRQADLTQEQLELEHRPWIAVDVAPNSPVVFDERGCVLICNFTLTNVGHSVAKHVSLWTNFAILGLDDPIKARDALCDIMKQPQNQNSEYGWLLFPSQHAVESRPIIANPDKVKQALDKKVFQGFNAIGLHLVGCVDYPSPLDSKKRYQTRFVYLIGYIDTERHCVMGSFDPSTKIYPNIALTPTMHGASAD